MKNKVEVAAELAAKPVEAKPVDAKPEEPTIAAKVGGFFENVAATLLSLGIKAAVKTVEFGGAVGIEVAKKVGGILVDQLKAIQETTAKDGIVAGLQQTASGVVGTVVGGVAGAGLAPIVASNTAAIMPSVIGPLAPVFGAAAGVTMAPALALGGLVTGVTYHKEIGDGVVAAANIAKDGVNYVADGIYNKIHDARVDAAKNTQSSVDVDYSENDTDEQGYNMLMFKAAKDAQQANSNIEIETVEPKAESNTDLTAAHVKMIKPNLF